MTVIPGTHLDDVSEFQPSMPWPSYFQARNAAIIRVDYGTSHPDLQWVQNHPARTAAGLSTVTGLYQYLVAAQDPTAQANAFCDMVGALSPGEFYVVDCEEGSNMTQALLAWFNVVDHRLGLRGHRRLQWEADYESFTNNPPGPWDLWQHTNGSLANHDCQPAVPGAPACDCSVYPGTIQQLRALVDQFNSCLYSGLYFRQANVNLGALDAQAATNAGNGVAPGTPPPAPPPAPPPPTVTSKGNAVLTLVKQQVTLAPFPGRTGSFGRTDVPYQADSIVAADVNGGDPVALGGYVVFDAPSYESVGDGTQTRIQVTTAQSGVTAVELRVWVAT